MQVFGFHQIFLSCQERIQVSYYNNRNPKTVRIFGFCLSGLRSMQQSPPNLPAEAATKDGALHGTTTKKVAKIIILKC